MGSMNTGGGQKTRETPQQESAQLPERSGEDTAGPPAMEKHPGADGSAGQAAAANDLALYGLCGLILAAAMLFALLYQRRRKKREPAASPFLTARQ